MSHAAIAHAVNGFFDAFRSKPTPQVAASRAAQVRVVSRYNEGDDESLLESATSLPRPTLKALEKAIRADGFKGAQVSGWNQGQRGGFTVHYGKERYEFEISENVTPRPVGEIGRLVKESGRYGKNGRGIYHGTPAGKNDFVIYQGRGNRWRLDLVTTSSGNHQDVTGPNSGYESPEAAFEQALSEQHRRGIRGSAHVYIVDREGNYSDYEPTGAHLPFESNGRRTGILSDGTRVNVYHDDTGSGDPWTVVPHGEAWDAQARGGMRSMLGMSEHATGISQWSEGQEGRHLGQPVPWDHVPADIKRHVERRVVGESMVANARRKKGVTVDDLPVSPGSQVLACPRCHAEYSAARGDYFQMPRDEALACSSCEVPFVLRRRL